MSPEAPSTLSMVLRCICFQDTLGSLSIEVPTSPVPDPVFYFRRKCFHPGVWCHGSPLKKHRQLDHCEAKHTQLEHSVVDVVLLVQICIIPSHSCSYSNA